MNKRRCGRLRGRRRTIRSIHRVARCCPSREGAHGAGGTGVGDTAPRGVRDAQVRDDSNSSFARKKWDGSCRASGAKCSRQRHIGLEAATRDEKLSEGQCERVLRTRAQQLALPVNHRCGGCATTVKTKQRSKASPIARCGQNSLEGHVISVQRNASVPRVHLVAVFQQQRALLALRRCAEQRIQRGWRGGPLRARAPSALP